MGRAEQLNGQYIDPSKVKHEAANFVQDSVIDPAKQYIDKAKDLGVRAVDSSTEMVKAHPGYSILGAATLGFVAGAYLFRRR